jgi:hypothetical protein
MTLGPIRSRLQKSRRRTDRQAPHARLNWAEMVGRRAQVCLNRTGTGSPPVKDGAPLFACTIGAKRLLDC